MERTLAYLFALAAAAGCTSNTLTTCSPECAAGFHCDGGQCVPDTGLPDGGGGDAAKGCSPACGGLTPFCNGSDHCVGCTTDAQCPTGRYCKIVSDAVATCAIGCTDDTRCGGGSAKCCNMQCVDSGSDVRNCGGCGKACAAEHASAACVAGQCQPGACDPGWGDCNGMAADGCETNLHIDVGNCTACGKACALPHAIDGCADGCYVRACDFGFDDCNNDMMDGCETPVLTDAANCGSCGTPCKALPNASASCTAGNCVLGTCNAGFFNCDGDPANGCEANVAGDPKNCGKCGVVCPMNLPACAAGQCALAPLCDANLEVTYMNHCYYLDGSGGKCDVGYAMPSQAILDTISMMFVGKNYKHVVSSNCCIWNADVNENWGMNDHCNAPGPFTAGDVVKGGAGCTNIMNHEAMQLTLCAK
jgi:Cys-rich repeat protein